MGTKMSDKEYLISNRKVNYNMAKGGKGKAGKSGKATRPK